jgi:NhaA family Na+:H+ antiporter
MVVPALLYLTITSSTSATRGWGVPMATDIAFALGVLALLGRRVPPALRVFLAALAIADDLGAVAIIAIFYSTGIAWGAAAAGTVIVAAAALANRRNVGVGAVYAWLGLALWVATTLAGVHGTVAGFLIALAVPAGVSGEPGLLFRMEEWVRGWVYFLIMPLFALANAGLKLADMNDVWGSAVVTGVGAGLLLGKPVGIVGAAWLAVRAKRAALPPGVTWRMVVGVGILGGIGFTMSLFIANLAFGEGADLNAAKAGVLGASLLAGILGWIVLRGGGGPSQDAVTDEGRAISCAPRVVPERA